MPRWIRAILALAMMAALAPMGLAQLAPTAGPGQVSIPIPAMASTGFSQWYDVTQYGPSTHQLVYVPRGTASGLTVALECSQDGGLTSASTIGTGTSTSGGVISGTGYCTNVRVNWSSKTGTYALVNTYFGAVSTVSATVNTTGLATSAAQTDGTQKSKIVDGSNNTIPLPPALGANGGLKVDIVGGAGAGGTSSTVGSATPGSATAIGASDGTNMQVPRVFDLDAGAGTQYGIGVNLRKAASGGSVEFGTSSDPVRTDPTGTTTQPVSITNTVALAAGAAAIGTVQPGNTANTTPWLVNEDAAKSVTTTMQSAVTANGNGTVLATDGQGTVHLSIKCSVSCSGGTAVQFFGQSNGTDFTAVWGVQDGTNTIATSTTPSGTTAEGWTFSAQSMKQFRAAIASYSAGTITVTGTTNPNGVMPPVINANVVAITGSLAAGSALIGSVTDKPNTTAADATSPCYFASDGAATAKNCKASAGVVYHIHVLNTTATLYFLKPYNLTTTPNCASATGYVRSYGIPANTAGAGIDLDISAGQGFATGVGFCLTATASSTDAAPAASGVYVNWDYK